MMTKSVTAIGLFSGGLDSILACRVMMEQGIRVVAVKFVTPFFDYHLLAQEAEYARQIKAKFGIEVILRDISEEYFTMLRNPAHGYGKNFNPCVDCKILLFTEACRLLTELEATFLVTGEVIGQRPMSQRRDTLRVIQRDSKCEDLLLRPLCAKLLSPTRPEIDGLVDREKLYSFSGRNRTPQIELAEEFGISDYPAPAGGCTLTDPNKEKRFVWFHKEFAKMEVSDARLLLFGRHFALPGGGWFILGRDGKENEKIINLAKADDIFIRTKEWPGPAGILRYSKSEDDIDKAVSLVKRYSKKGAGRDTAVVLVAQAEDFPEIGNKGGTIREVNVPPVEDKVFGEWCL